MLTAISIIILLACVVMAFFVLIQNPKGGGLSGTFGGMSTQVMGVQRSGNVMVKGTWISMAVIAALSILTVALIPKFQNQNVAPQRTQQSAPVSNNAMP